MMLWSDANAAYRQLCTQKGWPLKGERWTADQVKELQRELMQRYLLDPLYVAASDAVASLSYDKIDAYYASNCRVEGRKAS